MILNCHEYNGIDGIKLRFCVTYTIFSVALNIIIIIIVIIIIIIIIITIRK